MCEHYICIDFDIYSYPVYNVDCMYSIYISDIL